MKRGLIVGISDYDNQPQLPGAIVDANAITELLRADFDHELNFECRTVTGPPERITVGSLRPLLHDLFEKPAQVALFYFAGHGSITFTGGSIVLQESTAHDPGIGMQSIVQMANNSQCDQVVIILDCCHSGATGNTQRGQRQFVELREGVSILAASRDYDKAAETDKGGIFTGLVCEALRGGAADVMGLVNVAGVYGYVDRVLGAWGQRPMLKSHVSSLTPLRRCEPVIPLKILHKIRDHFPSPEYTFHLDESFEPTSSLPNEKNTKIFDELQYFYRAGLVKPDGGEKHMYYAAMNKKSCSLTPLGQFYWRLAGRR